MTKTDEDGLIMLIAEKRGWLGMHIALTIVKKVHLPFYEASVEKNEEIFHDDAYRAVWEDAEEATGHRFSVKERVDLLREMQSITHIAAEGRDFFYSRSLEDYWFEIAELIEEKYD